MHVNPTHIMPPFLSEAHADEFVIITEITRAMLCRQHTIEDAIALDRNVPADAEEVEANQAVNEPLSEGHVEPRRCLRQRLVFGERGQREQIEEGHRMPTRRRKNVAGYRHAKEHAIEEEIGRARDDTFPMGYLMRISRCPTERPPNQSHYRETDNGHAEGFMQHEH